jgi:hypothetical protein
MQPYQKRNSNLFGLCIKKTYDLSCMAWVLQKYENNPNKLSHTLYSPWSLVLTSLSGRKGNSQVGSFIQI